MVKQLVLVFLLYISCLAQEKQINPVDYVNPFIGTAGEGNTFPGAVVPWGMVSVSPHNTFFNPAGYKNGEKYFYGFGHVHLSGVGCNELGSVILTAANNDSVTDPEQYKTTYSNEEASPGNYSLVLNDLKIRAMVTAAKRSGMTMFIPTDSGKVHILLDAGRSLAITGGGKVIIRSDNVVEGYSISGGFCGELNREKIFFSAKFSKNAMSKKIWLGTKFIKEIEAELPDTSIGVIFSFNVQQTDTIMVKVGISYVSIENARANVESEIPEWDFQKIQDAAAAEWNINLSRVLVEEGSQEDFIKFYTALYHMLVHPNVITDVNGEYPLMGRKGTGRYQGRERYSIYSLWDTYRTLHPFLTLVYPEKQSEMVKTMIDMFSESGYLPKWELAGIETYMMVGDPAVPVIADTYIKGITDFDTNKAFESVLKPVLLKENQAAPPVRAGYHELLKYGYIPFEQDWSTDWWVWGPVSTSLEYNLADWAISRMAAKIGDNARAKEFDERSLNYRNLFDPVSLFMRPKLKNGKWMEPFDPLITEGSGDWKGSGGPGYVEGNSWNYTWFVPHDIPGLIKLFGGEKKFSQKLQEAFSKEHFTINNEPDIAYPYLFNYITGEENKTRELVSKIIQESFGTGPGGLPGNDDCGAISGWLVFSMLGFYPDCPASPEYQLGVPLFSKSTIYLNNNYYSGKTFVIEKDSSKSFSSGVKIVLNGTSLNTFRLNHQDIVRGGRLEFRHP